MDILLWPRADGARDGLDSYLGLDWACPRDRALHQVWQGRLRTSSSTASRPRVASVTTWSTGHACGRDILTRHRQPWRWWFWVMRWAASSVVMVY